MDKEGKIDGKGLQLDGPQSQRLLCSCRWSKPTSFDPCDSLVAHLEAGDIGCQRCLLDI